MITSSNIDPRVIRPGVSAKRGVAEVIQGDAKSGMTIFEKKKVQRLIVPGGNRARDRLIRLHEVLHANNSSSEQDQAKKYKVSELTCQAVEDGYVHLVYWPKVTRSMQRDTMAVALQDLRALFKLKDKINEPQNYMAYNVSLAQSLRSYSMVMKAWNLERSDEILRVVDKARDLIKAIFGNDKMPKALFTVMGLICLGKRRGRLQALALFEALLKKPVGEGQSESFGPEQGDPGEGEETKEPMGIVELPKTERTSNESPQWWSAKTGMRINVNRLPGVLATLNPMGLFEKEVMVSHGGTVLIDGSGSMNCTKETMTQLCRIAPGATVAFYGGNGQNEQNHYGNLVVFAKDGMRAEEIPGCYDENSRGGNEVDFYAIQWLLKQEPPFIMVTDQAFCGGPKGQAQMAKVLLGMNRQQITVYGSIEEALGVFQAMK